MLFDLTGKRKHVVRVVYAILALLMGASLFLVVGPFNLASVLNTESSVSAADSLDDQAERIEHRLVRDPKNDALLLSLARARLNAGNARMEVNVETGAQFATPEARQEFEQGMRAWSNYVAATKEAPNPTVAQLVARANFSLAESSATLQEAATSVEQAAAAQRIAAEAQPTLNTLSTLAIFEYYAGDFAAGDKATKEAAAKAVSKAQAKEVKKQMAEFRKRGKAFAKQKKQAEKEEAKFGKERLQNPLGGLGTGSSLAP